MADENDPLLDGYLGLEHFRLTDDDMTSRRIRDMPYGRPPRAITVTPELVVFADTLLGSSATTCKATVFNAGIEAIDITEMSVVGDFSISFNPVTDLMPGDKVDIAVVFTPIREGVTTGGIYVHAKGASGDKFIKLKGRGYIAETP